MKFAPIGSFRPRFSDSTGVCPSRSESFQVINALLLPLVLGFLYLLARRLPLPHRLSGGYAVIVALTITLTAGFGVYAALASVGQ